MKFVTIRDFRSHSAEIQKELPVEKEMVLTSNGKPVAIISAVSEKNLEETLAVIRRGRAALAVSMLQTESLKAGKDKMAPGDIEAEIKQVRKRRQR